MDTCTDSEVPTERNARLADTIPKACNTSISSRLTTSSVLPRALVADIKKRELARLRGGSKAATPLIRFIDDSNKRTGGMIGIGWKKRVRTTNTPFSIIFRSPHTPAQRWTT